MISRLKLLLNELLVTDDNIRAVYGIGSIAKGKEELGDIDLNFFVENSDFQYIEEIKILCKKLNSTLGKEIDVNIIDMYSVHDNIINSEIFPHKARHSLFLYELSCCKCLLYGDDIIDQYIVADDLKNECIKLTLTQPQRMSKEFLTKKNIDCNYLNKRFRKYCKYSLEFCLIYLSIENPYYELDVIVLQRFLNLDEDEIETINSINNNVTIPYMKTYNLANKVARQMRNEYVQNT